MKEADLLCSEPNLTTKYFLFHDPFRPKERTRSGLQIKPGVEALGQVFVKILPGEHNGYARVVQSF
jgi:hypothetical protein